MIKKPQFKKFLESIKKKHLTALVNTGNSYTVLNYGSDKILVYESDTPRSALCIAEIDMIKGLHNYLDSIKIHREGTEIGIRIEFYFTIQYPQ